MRVRNGPRISFCFLPATRVCRQILVFDQKSEIRVFFSSYFFPYALTVTASWSNTSLSEMCKTKILGSIVDSSLDIKRRFQQSIWLCEQGRDCTMRTCCLCSSAIAVAHSALRTN